MTTQGLLAKVLINKEQGSTGSPRTVFELEAKVLKPFPPYEHPKIHHSPGVSL
jgi:hypothetical protein